MNEVAKAARISRPGLYFLFDSKQALFRASVGRALDSDLADVDRRLRDTSHPLPQRLIAAFDRWAGTYIGPLAHEIEAVIDDNPDLLGKLTDTAPQRFEELITTAILNAEPDQPAAALAQTMISTSIGIKHQTTSRETYIEHMTIAINLLLR